MRVAPLDEQQGRVALGLVLRHLANVGIFMQSTAHPDDENNALLVMLNRGQGYRTALATATRGNGGQNEIGPEIFEALGLLRTGELAALHRFDGAEQYFTRAVDFGYSFGIDETFEKWGREEITEDYVRLIRMIRPDVVTALPSTGNAGGQHHMASSVITRDAIKLAGDPTKYPGQIEEGLRPWQVRKFYETAGGFGGNEASQTGRIARINTGGYDRLLGRTYSEIGSEARSMHKCQGMAQLLALPGPSVAQYRLVESMLPAPAAEERSLFEGIDSTVAGLSRFAGQQRPPRELTQGLSAITDAVKAAQRDFDLQNDGAALQTLLNGLRTVRVLRSQLATMKLDDAAKFEIDFRLNQKEGEFQQAALLANDVRVEALANDGVVVPGQPVNVDVIVANRGAADVTVKQVRFAGFDGDRTCVMTAFTGGGGRGGPSPGSGQGGGNAGAKAAEMSTIRKDQAAHCDTAMTVPPGAKVTEPYWQRENYGGRYTFDADAAFGLPYRPTPFYVQVTLGMPGGNGDDVIHGLPVMYRYQGDIFSGEKRSELLVVPPCLCGCRPRSRSFRSMRSRPQRPNRRPKPRRPRRARPPRPARRPEPARSA
jgi:LmbE family N-acetylglucosaminyl deacetylase